MKAHCLFLTVTIACSIIFCNAQHNTGLLTKITQAEQALKQQPKNQQAWQQLYALLNDNYVKLTAAERTRLRKVLEQYGIWSTGITYTVAEPGIKIIIKGHVINAQGKPVPNATLHIFQTDSRGYYTPLDSAERKMGEPDARLFCFLKTDSNGNFEINTIRPASYPLQYNGKTIPQHIHNNITAAGYKDKNLQMVFDDDPAMNDYWRQWATSNGYPILKLNNTVPQRIATVEIILAQ
jgi:protocatechuate 3,4-dioxygenase beta subunit